MRVLERMTSYVANHEKKNRIFAKRQRELLHAIKHEVPAERLLIAAERLRAAKIGVFKCRYSKSSEKQPHSFSPEADAAHNKQLQRWLSMSADEIVGMYRAAVA